MFVCMFQARLDCNALLVLLSLEFPLGRLEPLFEFLAPRRRLGGFQETLEVFDHFTPGAFDGGFVSGTSFGALAAGYSTLAIIAVFRFGALGVLGGLPIIVSGDFDGYMDRGLHLVSEDPVGKVFNVDRVGRYGELWEGERTSGVCSVVLSTPDSVGVA